MALPEQDEAYLREKGYLWELVATGGEQLLILHGYELPPDKYAPSVVDMLIRIPAGYPMVFLDMFFIAQEVRKTDGTFPTNISQLALNGGTWHQWSRHYGAGAWRPGIDGIETHLRAVRTELERGR